jgi:predicted enzyme related to lactoylglutathione lyase
MASLIVEGVVLYSKDLAQAKDFYSRILGLPVLLEEPHVIHFDGGSVRLAIHRYPIEGAREAPEGFVVFAVDDLAKTYEDLRRKGAEFLGPPASRPYGRVAYLHDPEGHEIGLLEEPVEGTEGRRLVAPLIARYERVSKKLQP